MPQPTMPEKEFRVEKTIDLGTCPSVEDVVDGFTMIRQTHPDAKPSEILVKSYEGGWDSDPETGYELYYGSSRPNTDYEKQMMLYHEAMVVWHKEEHEIQMRINSEYRARVEQENARKEWKARRHNERMANRMMSRANAGELVSINDRK